MSFTSMLNQTMDVTRVNTSRDGMGGTIEATTTAYTTVPCRVDALSTAQRAMSGSFGVVVTHRIFCGPGYTFEDTDTLTIDSTQYDVVTANDLHGHHIEIDAKQRRPER